MTEQDTSPRPPTQHHPRQRAIEAYDGARDRAAETLGEAPLLALAGGIAAGALIAALLPRTKAETRAGSPDRAAGEGHGPGRLRGRARIPARSGSTSMGFTREKGEQTSATLLDGVNDAAKASANAALDAARNKS